MVDLPSGAPPPGEWADRAACKGEPVSTFYPEPGARAARALVICRRCDVRDQCLAYAIDNNQHWGVWGGMTERQRWQHKRQLRQSL